MHTSKSSTNYLLNAAYNDETCQDPLRIAFRLAKSGKHVLYIAAKPPESLPIEDEYDDELYRDILKNIVFSYSSNAHDLINYFMGIQQMQPRPEVLVVDFLHTFFDNVSSLDTDHQLQRYFIECHMLITAGAISAVDMLSNDSVTQFISIISIDPDYHRIYKRFIQTYIDSYYYKEGCISTSSDLLNRFC
ncbi:uncharacterized protein LOC129569966 [Sitodiplosis mosellana]|uniref:uncharacterized protein LOC129569966 n=1 Tax=Sitodiplosis mosellana TaxID=263140 RepID=UPI0024441C10|nr:uncharacterized protein LOC129569966 [Sitodiplosis mosellana]